MGIYILKRLLLIIPTLFFILLINFAVVQIAPGGPVEQAIHQAETFQRGEQSDLTLNAQNVQYQGARGLSPEMVEKIKLTNVRVYVTGSNLYYFTKYSGLSPEVQGIDGGSSLGLNDAGAKGTYPVPRNITLGLNIGL